MARKITVAPTQVKVPRSREEVSGHIAEIGIRSRDLARLETAMNERISALKTQYVNDAKPHNEAIERLTKQVQTWCEIHRDEITQEGKIKSADLGTGTVSWRKCPPKVVLKGIEAIITALKAKRSLANRFLRTKQEINKDAILADPAAVKNIPGIKVEQGAENFSITPFETEIQKAV